MSDPNDRDESKRPSGGVNISGGEFNVGGDFVLGDKFSGNKTVNIYSPTQIEQIFAPLAEAIRAAPPEKRQEAEQNLAGLVGEAKKGQKADDTLMAKFVKGLEDAVPTAVAIVVGVFGHPFLTGIAGPMTKYALDKLKHA